MVRFLEHSRLFIFSCSKCASPALHQIFRKYTIMLNETRKEDEPVSKLSKQETTPLEINSQQEITTLVRLSFVTLTQ